MKRNYHILRISSNRNVNLFPSIGRMKLKRIKNVVRCDNLHFHLHTFAASRIRTHMKEHYDVPKHLNFLHTFWQFSLPLPLIHFIVGFNNLYDSRDIHDGGSAIDVANIISIRSMQQWHKTEISFGECINRFNKLHRSQRCTVSEVSENENAHKHVVHVWSMVTHELSASHNLY